MCSIPNRIQCVGNAVGSAFPGVQPITKRKARNDRAFRIGGDEETRTPDPLHAKQVLYQLSYIPRVTFALGGHHSTGFRMRDAG